MRFLFLLILAGLDPGHAAERVNTWPKWQQSRVALDRHFVAEEFRIHYALSGLDALPLADQADKDGDGVPDKIQDLARQLVTARRCYVEVLGLRPPLESPRYRGRVEAIDVNVWTLGNKNGSAGDAIVNYHRLSDPPEGVEVLSIDLAAKLPPGNLSPAHELFHLFQNGYSLFKNAWYYEGMARWSEDLLRAGAGPADALPDSWAEFEAVFARSYEASRIWQALARATDPAGRVRLPPVLRDARYLGSGKPIVEDDVFYGALLLEALLEELDRVDDAVSAKEKLDPLDWPEARQRSPENNRVIAQAVQQVFQRLAPGTPIADAPETK